MTYANTTVKIVIRITTIEQVPNMILISLFDPKKLLSTVYELGLSVLYTVSFQCAGK